MLYSPLISVDTKRILQDINIINRFIILNEKIIRYRVSSQEKNMFVIHNHAYFDRVKKVIRGLKKFHSHR
ncbi:hypothetical protein RIR_jg9012.t1 [Rhizophagus irregularis DAOM 181602=DAOM 197198]|nr:hypothetical protein RIR_jg9012.t1 [Rhizophagus irregularis DAOM 181602=DAOM 197198]